MISREQHYWESMGGFGSHPWTKAEVDKMSLDAPSPEEWDKASDRQVGGGHYKDFKIQPIVFVMANKLDFCSSNAIKYICRHEAKGGEQDIDKAIHYLELLKEHKYGPKEG